MKYSYKELEKIIDKIAPLSLQEEWDNSGWQINLNNPEIKRVLVCLDVTDAVIDEAIEHNCQMIVSHHPMYFEPIRTVDSNHITGNYTTRLIGAGISVYASHTPFDIVSGGNNDYIAKKLGIEDVEFLKGDELKICRTGKLEKNLTISELIDLCEEAFGVNKGFFNLVGNPETEVKKLAWCSGAGSEFIELAKAEDCDLFITGDLKYHQALNAREWGMNVLDMGHYATEIGFIDNMSHKLKEVEGLRVLKSFVNDNPFSVF